MNKLILVAAVSILLLSACEKNDGLDKKPNILLVIADDLGLDATPGYNIGSTKPNMPHLQSLANTGISFDNVWSNPVCSPTRSGILTGRYGYRTGVLNAEDASTIPITEKTLHSLLDDNTGNEYSHAIIGKWHLSNNEPSRPTQMGVGYYAGLLGGGVNDYNSWPLTENGQTGNYSGYITTKITDLAIDWIGQQQESWFCWVAYTAPHTPFHLPPLNMHSQGNLPTDTNSINANPMPYFMAMTESIDYEMGRLFDAIPQDELANTTIIFIGDNGTHPDVIQAPYQFNQSKGTLYQGGIHVPMIISGAGVSRTNARDSNLICTTDLFSSIAEMASIDMPVYEDSYSFKDLLDSEGAGSREYNYSEVENTNLPNRSGYTIRNYTYKLIVFNSGQQRFYDLSADPYEQNNLLSGTLTAEQTSAFQELMNAANSIRQ